ncbi:hypothetical protein D3C81_959480 [compost metagenome]
MKLTEPSAFSRTSPCCALPTATSVSADCGSSTSRSLPSRLAAVKVVASSSLPPKFSPVTIGASLTGARSTVAMASV